MLGYKGQIVTARGVPRRSKQRFACYSPPDFTHFRIRAVEPVHSPSNTPGPLRQFRRSDEYQEISRCTAVFQLGTIHNMSVSHSQFGIQFPMNADPGRDMSAYHLSNTSLEHYSFSPGATCNAGFRTSTRRKGHASPSIRRNYYNSTHGLIKTAGWECSPKYVPKIWDSKLQSKWSSADSPNRQRPSAGLPNTTLITAPNASGHYRQGVFLPGLIKSDGTARTTTDHQNGYSPIATADNNWWGFTIKRKSESFSNGIDTAPTLPTHGLDHGVVTGLSFRTGGANKVKYWLIQGSKDGNSPYTDFKKSPESPHCSINMHREYGGTHKNKNITVLFGFHRTAYVAAASSTQPPAFNHIYDCPGLEKFYDYAPKLVGIEVKESPSSNQQTMHMGRFQVPQGTSQNTHFGGDFSKLQFPVITNAFTGGWLPSPNFYINESPYSEFFRTNQNPDVSPEFAIAGHINAAFNGDPQKQRANKPAGRLENEFKGGTMGRATYVLAQNNTLAYGLDAPDNSPMAYVNSPKLFGGPGSNPNRKANPSKRKYVFVLGQKAKAYIQGGEEPKVKQGHPGVGFRRKVGVTATIDSYYSGGNASQTGLPTEMLATYTLKNLTGPNVGDWEKSLDASKCGIRVGQLVRHKYFVVEPAFSFTEDGIGKKFGNDGHRGQSTFGGTTGNCPAVVYSVSPMHSAAGSPRVRIRLGHATTGGGSAFTVLTAETARTLTASGDGVATISGSGFDTSATHVKTRLVSNDSYNGIFPIRTINSSTVSYDIGFPTDPSGGPTGVFVSVGTLQDAGNSLRNCSPNNKAYRDGFFGKIGKDNSPNGGINSVKFSGDGNSPELQEFQFEMGYSIDNGTIVGNNDTESTEDFGSGYLGEAGRLNNKLFTLKNCIRPSIDSSPFIASFQLPDSAPIIIKKKPSDRVYSSDGIAGGPVYAGSTGVLFTPVNRPR